MHREGWRFLYNLHYASCKGKVKPLLIDRADIRSHRINEDAIVALTPFRSRGFLNVQDQIVFCSCTSFPRRTAFRRTLPLSDSLHAGSHR